MASLMAESRSGQRPVAQRFRGYAVLISNETFITMDYEGDPTRYGAREDDINMQYLFDTKLKFKLLDGRTYLDVFKSPFRKSVASRDSRQYWIHNDPPTDKAKCYCLSCKIQTTVHSESECFVLAISTHGGLVDGKQEMCFSDDPDEKRVTLSDIIETLNDENCKTLKDKPRIILLQMCRNNPDVPEDKQNEVWHDHGDTLDDVQCPLENLNISDDARPKNAEDESETRVNDTNTSAGQELAMGAEFVDIHGTDKSEGKSENEAEPITEEYYYGTEEALQNLPPNFLVIFPSVSGKKTFHTRTNGSWLIDEMRKVVEDHDFNKEPNMNFLSVLTLTAGRVARDKESEKGYKTAVCLVHRLLEPLIFKDIPDTQGREEPSLIKDKPAL